mgnify:FL=1
MTTEVTKALTPTQVGVMNFTKSINSSYVQNQLKQVLGKNAGTFATSLVEVFTNDTQLQKCEQKKVIQEAIKAATLKLPLNKQLGYAYILVFNNWDKAQRKSVPTPQIVLGYRGYIQLAMRTGQYKNINADVVYEGEMVGRDKLSGAIDLSGDKISEKVVGYFAHFETVNGFSKTLFMSLGEMAGYALKFSPSFKRNAEKNPLPTVDALCDMANDQAVNGPQQGKVGWEGDFNSMAIKTVLRRLLSKYGYLSIEMMSALAEDESSAVEQRNEENNETKPVFDAQAVEIKEEESKPVEDCPI